MAVTSKIYGDFLMEALDEGHDLVADTIKVLLTTSAYTPDQDAHDFLNDITNEVSGTGYSAGGETLANKTLTYTGGSNLITFDADNVQWATVTVTFRTAVVYNATGGGADSSRGLISYYSNDGDISSTGGNLDIIWNASGIFTITVA